MGEASADIDRRVARGRGHRRRVVTATMAINLNGSLTSPLR